jgi:hypothetical protein
MDNAPAGSALMLSGRRGAIGKACLVWWRLLLDNTTRLSQSVLPVTFQSKLRHVFSLDPTYWFQYLRCMWQININILMHWQHVFQLKSQRREDQYRPILVKMFTFKFTRSMPSLLASHLTWEVNHLLASSDLHPALCRSIFIKVVIS